MYIHWYIHTHIYVYINNQYAVVCTQSCPTLCNPMTVARQAPLSMEFSRQEYWGGLSFPPPGDLPNPGIESTSPVSCTDRQILCHWATWEAHISVYKNMYHTYQGQIKLWTFKYQLLSMGRWGNGWLGLHKLITEGNREAFNPVLNKTELNIHYKKA